MRPMSQLPHPAQSAGFRLQRFSAQQCGRDMKTLQCRVGCRKVYMPSTGISQRSEYDGVYNKVKKDESRLSNSKLIHKEGTGHRRQRRGPIDTRRSSPVVTKRRYGGYPIKSHRVFGFGSED